MLDPQSIVKRGAWMYSSATKQDRNIDVAASAGANVLERSPCMRFGVMVLSYFFIFCGTVWAQATAQISGAVRDQSGAVIPGVEIKVTQTATGAVRTVVSNEGGQYVFANLPL